MQLEVDVLGDVHLGKKFTTGVPLHRRGEREQMVFEEFVDRIMHPRATPQVQVGDLFDAYSVDDAVVLATARAYKSAAAANPKVNYVVNRGNHDASRDTNKASSFDMFREMVRHVANIKVSLGPHLFLGGNPAYGVLAWEPFRTAEETALTLEKMWLESKQPKLDFVFTHCDLESFGGSTFNVLPADVLRRITSKVYNGHVHTPETRMIQGLEVVNVGSMQPYSHAEDPDSRLYRTISFEEVTQAYPGVFHDLNLRVLLEPGQVLPEIDCLSIIPKTSVEAPGEVPDIAVELQDFNLQALMAQSLSDAQVGPTVAQKILTKYEESRNVA